MAIIFKYLDKPLSLIFYKRYEIFLVLVFIAAVIIRLQNTFHESMWSDEALYAWCGFRIFAHPGLLFSKEIISFHPPLFSFFIGFAHLFLPSEIAARIVSPIFGSLAIFLVYLLGKELRNKFVGVVCSIILAFHYVHIFDSTRILIDATLATFFMMLILLLFKCGTSQDLRKNILVGIVASAVVLLKWSGVLVIPLMALYYLLLVAFAGASFRTIKKPLIISLSIPILLTIFLLINNYIKLGSFLADTSAFARPIKPEPFWLYFIHLVDLLDYRYLLPFFLYGFMAVYKEKPQVKSMLFSWFFAVFIILSFIPTKLPRYALPMVPAMLLITGIGIDNAIRFIAKPAKSADIIRLAIIALILFNGIFGYASTKALLDFDKNRAIGYREAGAWVRKNVPLGALILADSDRQIRYYSGRNYKEFNGSIIELAKLKNEIKNIIFSAKEPIFLELDIWNSRLNSFILKERIRFFAKLGFTVQKETDINSNGKLTPAFVILRR